MREPLKYTDAIKEATDQLMASDADVFVIGLGVSYPKGADGTTAGLKAKYPDRIFDVPVSENAVTGMSVGSAIQGLRPIVHHGRIEFALLAMDPILTQAAKWNYMFGGGNPVPIVFRINIGRQWGNGPQHTQALYSLFGNTLGLKVVIPSTPKMAKGLLASAVRENNPVVILEPRWLFNVKEEVPEDLYEIPLGKARVGREGSDITIVSYGDGYVAALEACEMLEKEGVNAELIDLVSINPIDWETVFASIRKTGKLFTIDTTNEAFNIGSEVIAHVAREKTVDLKERPISLSTPNVPCPTSPALTDLYYPTSVSIANATLRLFGKRAIEKTLTFEQLHLAPSVLVK